MTYAELEDLIVDESGTHVTFHLQTVGYVTWLWQVTSTNTPYAAVDEPERACEAADGTAMYPGVPSLHLTREGALARAEARAMALAEFGATREYVPSLTPRYTLIGPRMTCRFVRE